MPIGVATSEMLERCFVRAIDHAGDTIFTIRLQSFPTGLSWSKGANWQPTEITGRSHPLQGYQSSSPKQMSFATKYVLLNDENGWETSAVVDEIRKWESLVYPRYAGGTIRPPNKVIINFGEIYMVAILTEVSISSDDAGGWVPIWGIPNVWDIQVTAIEIWSLAQGESDVRRTWKLEYGN